MCCQFLLIGRLCRNHRPRAACLAGPRRGYSAISRSADRWRLERRFEAWDSKQVDDRYKGWQRAVQAVRQFAE